MPDYHTSFLTPIPRYQTLRICRRCGQELPLPDPHEATPPTWHQRWSARIEALRDAMRFLWHQLRGHYHTSEEHVRHE